VVLIFTTAGFSFLASPENVSLVMVTGLLRVSLSRVFQKGSAYTMAEKRTKTNRTIALVSRFVFVRLVFPVFTAGSPFQTSSQKCITQP
jgi:hypothetical protein